jgi:glucosamine-phosphate N-acetyltransferase
MIYIRPLEESDYYRGYMELINTFTRNPRVVAHSEFCKACEIITHQGGIIFVALNNDLIVGTLKLVIEQKLHNNLKTVAHIEDIVTSPTLRKSGVASQLIECALNECKSHNCYKIVLTCNKELVEFYKHRGFIEKGAEMTIYTAES